MAQIQVCGCRSTGTQLQHAGLWQVCFVGTQQREAPNGQQQRSCTLLLPPPAASAAAAQTVELTCCCGLNTHPPVAGRPCHVGPAGVHLHTPPASANPLTHPCKLTQQHTLATMLAWVDMSYPTPVFRKQAADRPCDPMDGMYPMPACCSELECKGSSDCAGGRVCGPDTTFVACCPASPGGCQG